MENQSALDTKAFQNHHHNVKSNGGGGGRKKKTHRTIGGDKQGRKVNTSQAKNTKGELYCKRKTKS